EIMTAQSGFSRRGGIMQNRGFVAIAIAASLLLVLQIALGASAQVGSKPGGPAFDVASVKLNNTGARGYSLPPPSHGRMTAANVPLKQLIVEAYQVQEYQVTGGPAWINSEGYDITAKGDANAGKRQVYQMLQKLLADRFQLTLHQEMKVAP